MKNTLTYFIIAVLSFASFNAYAQSIAISEASLSESPLGTVENNGSAIATINLVESSGVNVRSLAANSSNVKINVSLKYLELTDADVSQITGSGMDYFTVTYDEDIDVLRFSQNDVIPGDWYGSISFPVTVTQNSTKEESYNGLYANIYSMHSKTNSEGNASVFTNTEASVLAVTNPEDLDLPFEVLPNPTDGPLTIFLANNNDAKVEIFDLLGKKIFTKEYSDMNEIDLNIDHLASAVYLLKVTSNGVTNDVQIIRE